MKSKAITSLAAGFVATSSAVGAALAVYAPFKHLGAFDGTRGGALSRTARHPDASPNNL